MITIYHNPRCSKSREGLQLLELQHQPFTVVKYLDGSLTREDLVRVIDILNISPIELVRQKDAIWISDYKGRQLSDSDIIDALLKYPQLIERPILINGTKGVIARPAERVSEVIELTKL